MNYRDDSESLRAQVERLEQELAESRASRPVRRVSRWTSWDKTCLALLVMSTALRAGLIAACGFRSGDIAWGAAAILTLVILASRRDSSEGRGPTPDEPSGGAPQL